MSVQLNSLLYFPLFFNKCHLIREDFPSHLKERKEEGRKEGKKEGRKGKERKEEREEDRGEKGILLYQRKLN